MKINYDITFHPKWWHKNAGIDFSKSFFDDPRTRIDYDITMRKTLFTRFGSFGLGEENPEPRPLLGTNLLAAGYLHSEILGCTIQYAPDNSPVVVPLNYELEDIADNPVYTGLGNSKVWQKVEKQLAFLKQEYGTVESYINLMGVQNIAMDILGQDLMLAYYDDPESLHLLLRAITDCLKDTGKRLKEFSSSISEGVTAIIGRSHPETYLTSNCSCEMIPNALYEEFLLQYDIELAKEFKSYGIHHCGATMEHVINGYSKVPNIDFLEVGAGSEVTKIREVFPATFLNLRVSPVALQNSSERELEALVNNLVRDGYNEQKQLSVSCVGIDDSISDERISLFLKICDSIDI